MTGATANAGLWLSVNKLQSYRRIRKSGIRGEVGHVVIGNPENRRVQLFQEALLHFRQPIAIAVSYEQLLKFSLQRPQAPSSNPFSTALAHAKEQFSNVLLRIDSAGESFEVDRLMIAAGASALPATSACQSISSGGALRLRYDRGRLRYLRQYFAGFESLLHQIHNVVKVEKSVFTYSSIPEILIACDKVRCSDLLRANSVPAAQVLPSILSFDELTERMHRAGWKRAFVKHTHGSSAAGVIALDTSGARPRATTTMEMVGSGANTRFYNNLKVRTYQKVGEIRRLVDFLCCEGVHIEQWLPRACANGRVLDLRILAINGRCSHVVVRTSRSPITNLHLGNKRGDLGALQQAMGVRAWQRTMAVAEQTAACFPDCHCLGIDILIQPGFRSPTVIEVNAFGDLLPGVLFNGQSTYATEIQEMMVRGLSSAR